MRGWTSRRVKHLQEMAGTVGRQPAEPPIVSMGSIGPPHVEEPYFVRDRLVSDGAQVTRPSIDPYREPVETYVYLCGGKLRLSMPAVIKLSPNTPAEYQAAVVKAAYCMNVLADVGAAPPATLNRYGEALLADISQAGLRECAAYTASLHEVREVGRPVFVKAQPAEEYPWLGRAVELGASGVYLDEDLGGDVPVEVAVSVLDRELRELNLRNSVSVLAGGWSVRGSDDVYKLVALGADAVVLSKAVEHAVGLDGARAGEGTLRERVENLLLGMQREIKLLAGAAGVSNVFNTLVGSRELLRAVELDKRTRMMLGVKQAGVG
ncbi:MAG: glutamate synthase-related protein [Candidatus Caldarchaeum sp.]|nr:glutamate synthase-related protein [Candidatus Caldarchaeum sp.]